MVLKSQNQPSVIGWIQEPSNAVKNGIVDSLKLIGLTIQLDKEGNTMVEQILSLVTCLVPRRGKGKGLIEVKQFGVPTVDKEGITRDIQFPWIDKLSLGQIIDGVAQVEKNQRVIKECFLNGLNDYYRSRTAQAELETAMAVEWILEQDLAENEQKAIDLAKVWYQIQASMKAGMMPVPSFEDLAIPRRKYVDEQKSKSLWKLNLVKPVESTESTEGNKEVPNAQ